LGLFLLYQLNGTFVRIGDAQPNLYLPVQVLTRGSLSFTPEDAPFMFGWRLSGPRPRRVTFRSWNDKISGTPVAALRDAGQLSLVGPKYYLVESVKRGRYVGIYGPGAGLVAVPYFAVLCLVRPGWQDNGAVLGAEAKVFASACVAGSAVLIFWSFLLFLPRRPSLLLSLLYGAGTCVWTEPSQALWQQTPAIFFVALGAYAFLRIPEGIRFAAGCGAAWGLAAFCRPSLGILLAVGAVATIRNSPRAAVALALGGILPVAALAAWNGVYLGSPFRFGQVEAAHRLGGLGPENAGAWDGSLPLGLAGLLMSPSRGVFIFSPFFLYAAWGAIRCWRSPSGAPFRPFTAALACLLLMAACWVQWWGGWSFGYRLVVELVPLAMLLLIPVSNRFLTPRPLLSPFGLLAFWSIAIQTLGAFGYDPAGWNNRSAYRVRRNGPEAKIELMDQETALRLQGQGAGEILGTDEMDVSSSLYRRRLWSVTDSQLAWLLRPHAISEGTAARRSQMEDARREEEAQSPSNSRPFR
jgi:hypothetical protein